MRLALLLTSLALFNPGCSVLLYDHGPEFPDLETRGDVQSEFSKPVKIGATSDGHFETFISRKKYSNPAGFDTGYFYASSGFLLVLEPFFLTGAIVDYGKTKLVGNRFRIEFDKSENITRVLKNGQVIQFDREYFERIRSENGSAPSSNTQDFYRYPTESGSVVSGQPDLEKSFFDNGVRNANSPWFSSK